MCTGIYFSKSPRALGILRCRGGQRRGEKSGRSDFDNLKWQASRQCTGFISHLQLLFCKTELWHCLLQEASPVFLLLNRQAVLSQMLFLLTSCLTYVLPTLCYNYPFMLMALPLDCDLSVLRNIAYSPRHLQCLVFPRSTRSHVS